MSGLFGKSLVPGSACNLTNPLGWTLCLSLRAFLQLQHVTTCNVSEP